MNNHPGDQKTDFDILDPRSYEDPKTQSARLETCQKEIEKHLNNCYSSDKSNFLSTSDGLFLTIQKRLSEYPSSPEKSLLMSLIADQSFMALKKAQENQNVHQIQEIRETSWGLLKLLMTQIKDLDELQKHLKKIGGVLKIDTWLAPTDQGLKFTNQSDQLLLAFAFENLSLIDQILTQWDLGSHAPKGSLPFLPDQAGILIDYFFSSNYDDTSFFNGGQKNPSPALLRRLISAIVLKLDDTPEHSKADMLSRVVFQLIETATGFAPKTEIIPSFFQELITHPKIETSVTIEELKEKTLAVLSVQLFQYSQSDKQKQIIHDFFQPALDRKNLIKSVAPILASKTHPPKPSKM